MLVYEEYITEKAGQNFDGLKLEEREIQLRKWAVKTIN